MGADQTDERARDDEPVSWDEIEPGVPSAAAAIPGSTQDDPSRTDPTRVVNDDTETHHDPDTELEREDVGPGGDSTPQAPPRY